MLYLYAAIAFGYYLVVAQDRGRIVGFLAALIWPVIFGMWAALRAICDEGEMDWSRRVTWLTPDNK